MASSTTPLNKNQTENIVQSKIATPSGGPPPARPKFSPGRLFFALVALGLLAGLAGLAFLSATGNSTPVSSGPVATLAPTSSAVPATANAASAVPASPVSWNEQPVLYSLGAGPTAAGYQTLWAAMEAGLRRSTDGGKTWAWIDTYKDQTVTALAFDADDPEHGLYAGTARAGLFKSTDNGQTWKNLGLTGRPISQMAVWHRNLYVSATGTRPTVYHSADGGQTFAGPSANQLPPNLVVRSMSVDSSNPQNIYIGTAFVNDNLSPDWNRVKYSNDGGKTWQRVGPSLSPDSSDGPAPRQAVSILTYAANAGGLYAGDGDRLWHLSPDRNSWQPVESGLPTSGIYGLAVDPQLPGLLYSATRDGFYRNLDGQTWQKLASGEVSQLFPGDTNQAQQSVTPGMVAVVTTNPANSNQGLHSTLLYALSSEGRLTRYENRDFAPELVASTGASDLPDFSPYGGINPADRVAAPLDGAPTDPNKIYVKDSGHYIQGIFKDVWTDPTNNAPFFYGNPLSEQFLEFDYSAKITKTVQFFERVKFESTRPDQVNLAPIGREAIEGKFFPPGRFIETTTSQQYFKETKHTLHGAFFEFWQKNGSLRRFGFPISEETPDKDATGKDVVYQYFERVKLRFDPTTGKVSIAPLGQEVLQKRGWVPKS